MDILLRKIISDPRYALLAMFIMTAIFHLCFVYLGNLTKKQWKKVDYVWVSLSAIGLIGGANNAQLGFANRYISIANELQIPGLYKYVKSFLVLGDTNTSGISSPAHNLNSKKSDGLSVNENEVEIWRRSVNKIVSQVDTNKYTIIDTNTLPSIDTKNAALFDLHNSVKQSIRNYNNAVLLKDKNISQIETFKDRDLTYLLPLFLIIGLSLRITKVTGELKHERSGNSKS